MAAPERAGGSTLMIVFWIPWRRGQQHESSSALTMKKNNIVSRGKRRMNWGMNRFDKSRHNISLPVTTPVVATTQLASATPQKNQASPWKTRKRKPPLKCFPHAVLCSRGPPRPWVTGTAATIDVATSKIRHNAAEGISEVIAGAGGSLSAWLRFPSIRRALRNTPARPEPLFSVSWSF